MLSALLPRDGNFLVLFKRHAAEMERGAEALSALFANMDNIEARVREIKEIESAADRVVHDIHALLHASFITPFDRDQIHLLTGRMDDVIDFIEDVSQCVVLYGITASTPQVTKLADLSLASVAKVKKLVDLLEQPKNAAAVSVLAKEIRHLEGEADLVMRSAIADLFRSETDARELLKMKELYEHLEAVTDRCDDVSDVIESIVLENA